MISLASLRLKNQFSFRHSSPQPADEALSVCVLDRLAGPDEVQLLMLALGGDPKQESLSWRAREVLLPVLITSFLFGIVHALFYIDGGVRFDFIRFLGPFMTGLVYAALRLGTGSLLFPILAHNGGNFIAVLILYLL